VQSWWKERGPVVPHDSFPADCSLCHTSDGWRSIRADFAYDHGRETGHPLEGAHARAECLRCHNDRGPVQAFNARGCGGCHVDPHRGELGSTCETCHGEDDWRVPGAIAEHDRTRFPLVGAHAAAACWRCHPGAQAGNFSRADTACLACHAADLARALQPDHAAQGWIDGCERCHVPIAWGGGAFNHSAWPLVGQHLTAACSACHAGGVYAGTPRQCVDCHLADYQGAQSPDHVTLGISTDCADCHTPHGWHGAQFNHSGIVDGCYACHAADYQSAVPDHVGGGFPTKCEDCHTTSTWQGAQFDHSGIVDGCVNCHLAEYQSAVPNHVAAGFPTTCEDCHTTDDWDNATFSHSFPITSGKHRNFACSQCHLQPTNFQVFSCTHCHEHRQSKMDDEHQGEPGYVWESNACYSCHPDGQAD
jgi:hypothetical protein